MTTIKVALVDDSQIMLDALSLFLGREKDFKITGTATDGLAALSLVASIQPDVVVMDIDMPGMNGIEATRRLVAGHPKIRIVALSSHADELYVMAMLEAGAISYVVKSDITNNLIPALYAAVKDKIICVNRQSIALTHI